MTTQERIEEIIKGWGCEDVAQDVEILRLMLEALVIQAQLEQLKK